MLSKRANVLYLEHVRVQQDGERVVYLTQAEKGRESLFNIPEKNTAFVLLGKGSSITDAAVRRLAESNVMIGFCGSGGSPLFVATDIVFLPTQSEYRPTEYMQSWMKMWLDEKARLAGAKMLLKERIRLVRLYWAKQVFLAAHDIRLPDDIVQRFEKDIEQATTSQTLLLAEARWAKQLYKLLAQGYDMPFARKPGQKKIEGDWEEQANSFLDHGNYIAYGYASVALHGLGVSFALPLLHGKTRRGGLVFDIADLIKDAIVMPLAFNAAASGLYSRDFRKDLIELCQRDEVLDVLFGFIKTLCSEALDSQGVTGDEVE